jgi:hypothetical protein
MRRHRADFKSAVGRALDAAQFFDLAEADDFAASASSIEAAAL